MWPFLLLRGEGNERCSGRVEERRDEFAKPLGGGGFIADVTAESLGRGVDSAG